MLKIRSVTKFVHLRFRYPNTLLSSPSNSSNMADNTASSKKRKSSVKRITPMPVEEPIKEDQIRFVCISDTHGRHENYLTPIPNGDVLLHAGDFTMIGGAAEVKKFNDFLGSLPHPHKVVIAGNHDLSFDTEPSRNMYFGRTRRSLEAEGLHSAHSLLTKCCYLENAVTEVAGYKIFGSPQSPEFGEWAFMYCHGKQAARQWSQIPSDTDILITHGPPLGAGDRVHNGQLAGCPELLEVVQRRVQPRFHIFGHIHEDSGVFTDDTTTFINASICDLRYRPNNPPVIFDLPMPQGMTKDELHALTLKPEPVQPSNLDGNCSAI